MGYADAEASSGIRLSLGSWLCAADLEGVPAALEQARLRLHAAAPAR
jgi:hypothetical protein